MEQKNPIKTTYVTLFCYVSVCRDSDNIYAYIFFCFYNNIWGA